MKKVHGNVVDEAGSPDPRGDSEHGRPAKIKIIIPNGRVVPLVNQRQVVHPGRRPSRQRPANVVNHWVAEHRLRGLEDSTRPA